MAKQNLLDEMLEEYQRRENEFPVVNDLSKLPEKYKGLALEINDHGNVTIWKVFKNGNCRELANRV